MGRVCLCLDSSSAKMIIFPGRWTVHNETQSWNKSSDSYQRDTGHQNCGIQSLSMLSSPENRCGDIIPIVLEHVSLQKCSQFLRAGVYGRQTPQSQSGLALRKIYDMSFVYRAVVIYNDSSSSLYWLLPRHSCPPNLK